MRVREATPDDAALLAELWLALARENLPYSPLNELVDDAEAGAVDGFADMLASEEYTVLLLEVGEGGGAVGGDDEEAALGYAIVEIGERPSRRHGRYAAVNDLFVREGHRGEGHGTRLLAEAEDLAETEDCDFVRISAEWENDGARRLYEREGYTPKQATYTKRL